MDIARERISAKEPGELQRLSGRESDEDRHDLG
jgi:hypothetical protein